MKKTILTVVVSFAAFTLFSTFNSAPSSASTESDRLIVAQMSGEKLGNTGHDTRKGLGPATLDSGKNPSAGNVVGGADDTDKKDHDKNHGVEQRPKKGLGPSGAEGGGSPKNSAGSAQ